MRKFFAFLLIGVIFLINTKVEVVRAETNFAESNGKEWTDDEIKEDFIVKYFLEDDFIYHNVPTCMYSFLNEHLYISQEEKKEVEGLQIGEESVTETDGFYIEIGKNDDGMIRKRIVYNDNGELSKVENIQNEEVLVYLPGVVMKRSHLLEHELSVLRDKLKDKQMIMPEDDSIWAIRDCLADGESNNNSICAYSVNNTRTTKPVIDYEPIRENAEFGEVYAKELGTFSYSIAGSSEYTLQENDSIEITVYFSRPEFYLISESTAWFEAGKSVVEIAKICKFSVDLLMNKLAAYDLVDFALGLITADVEIVCDKAYQVVQYREATTVDYTTHMAEIEVSEEDCFILVNRGATKYDDYTGKFSDFVWSADKTEEFSQTVEEFAEESAQIYYNNCKEYGKWIWNTGALAGNMIELPSNPHTHIYSTDCDSYCDVCNFYREVKHTYTFWSALNASYHTRHCTKPGCGIVQKEAHVLAGYQPCKICGWKDAVAVASEDIREESEHE